MKKRACAASLARWIERAPEPRRGLTIDRVCERVEVMLRQGRRRRGQPEALEQQVRLVLVVRRARDLDGRYERRKNAVLARFGQDLDVEVGQRQDGADPVALAQRCQRGHVLGVVHRRHRDAHLRRVLRGRQRRGVGGDRVGERGEAGDDVVALADPV